jgi:ABC-2 type transport system permease protein
MLGRTLAAIWKETLVLSRDLHGLALLFVMPLAFILVMSLALQDAFDARGGAAIPVLVLDRDGTPLSAALAEGLSGQAVFETTVEAGAASGTTLERLDDDEDLRFVLVVPQGYGQAVLSRGATAVPELEVAVSTRVDLRFETIFLSLVREAAGAQRAAALAPPGAAEAALAPVRIAVSRPVAKGSTSGADARPSAVQQNVPAWLVFSIFFVAIPFSNTFIAERESGLHRRLSTTRMGVAEQFVGKLLPYLAINLAQTALMLAVGMWLVPRLGGDALVVRGDPLALAAVAASVSLAALSLALLIACLARTAEQATLLSGVGNIILAAVGGIMAPRFLMPETMQQVSALSPMGWGLDAFLALLLDGGGFADIAEPAIKLLAFATVCLALAAAAHRLRA